MQLLADYPEAVMQRLIKQLNSSLHMPKGMLYYTLPGGRQRRLETTQPWELSDWLRTIGLTLAAIGVIALTGGAGTAAGIAFVGAGLAGAASSKAALEEMEKQGIATDSDRARAYLNIAVDLIGALAGGVGMIARAPSMFGQVALMADRVYIPLRAAAATGELAQAALMTHDFVQNLQALAAQPDSKERTTGIVKLVAMGIAMGALTFVSLRGAVHEIGSGARPSVVANGDGTYSLVGPSGLPVAEGSGGFKWKAKADVAATAEDPTIGKKSVVIDVEKDANGLVTGVAVRKGTGASAADVALHEKGADMVARYGGAQGRIRNLWRDVLAKFGFRRPPVELELEIFKLEQPAHMRVKTLSSPGVTEVDRLAAERELSVIEHNTEVARANAQAALKKPAQTVAERAQIWMKEAPEGLPPAPENTQWVRNESGHWDLIEIGARPGPQIRAEYDENGKFLGISNRAQLAQARVLGRSVGEVEDRLKALGYSVERVEVDGKIQTHVVRSKEGLLELEVGANGKVRVTNPAKPPLPTSEFPATDATWKHWPPPAPPKDKPAWNEPGGARYRYARYRYDRYRYEKWEELGKPAEAPRDLLTPKQYYDRYVAPKAVGQSPGEMGSPEHKALVLEVRGTNKVGTQTMGAQRPDAVGGTDQPLAIPHGPTVTPQKGGRVLYEADNFYKDGSQIVSEGREQVRQFRKDNPNATIVVQDAANPKNVIIYEPGTQPPPGGRLAQGTAIKVPVN
ncbi:MAG: hypothetical protein ABI467_22815 [Kofleriaceae bacterium]